MGAKYPTPPPAARQPRVMSPPPPPRKFSPGLQELVDHAIQSRDGARFTARDLDEAFDCGFMLGVDDDAADNAGRPTPLGMAVAWFIAGAITWGLIGFAAGWYASARWGS